MNYLISGMQNTQPKTKLKPVVYAGTSYIKGSPQTTQQIILIKALQVTQDPKKLREMIGVRSVAEVYRTLDKLAMRKEYHNALANAGISFDFVVKGLKDIADGAEKDADRLKALQTILKSLGMEKYDVADAGGTGTWEEELLKALDKEKATQALPATQNPALPQAPVEEEINEYEVRVPETPESMKKLRAEEEKLTDGIYG